MYVSVSVRTLGRARALACACGRACVQRSRRRANGYEEYKHEGVAESADIASIHRSPRTERRAGRERETEWGKKGRCGEVETESGGREMQPKFMEAPDEGSK